jgi:hypothetical protein
VVPLLQATPTVTLWQRSPVAQSVSAVQYLRQVGPPPPMVTHPLPRAHCIVVVEHVLPIAPPSAPAMHATTATPFWQVKSHLSVAPQFWAAGSQAEFPESAPTSAGASLPPSAIAPVLPPPHADVTSVTTATPTSVAVL